jgi:hypothetical protein
MIRRPMLWSVVLLAGAAGALASWPREHQGPAAVALAPALAQGKLVQREPAPPPREVPRPPALPRPHVDPEPERSDDDLAMTQAESFDSLLERQGRDLTRREVVTDRARQAFAQAESDGIYLGAIECSESLCRVEVQLDDVDARRAFDHVISKIPAGTGEAFVYIENDDDLDIEVYVSPDDRPLPFPQNE